MRGGGRRHNTTDESPDIGGRTALDGRTRPWDFHIDPHSSLNRDVNFCFILNFIILGNNKYSVAIAFLLGSLSQLKAVSHELFSLEGDLGRFVL